MDWALAIERNRQPLLRIVAVLFGMIGLGDGERRTRVAAAPPGGALGAAPGGSGGAAADRGGGARDRGETAGAPPGAGGAHQFIPHGTGAHLVSAVRPAPGSGAAMTAALQAPAATPASTSSMSHSIPAFRCSARPRGRAGRPRSGGRITRSMPGRCAAVSPPSVRLSKTCRARRSAMPAGGPGPRRPAARSGWTRSAPARRPACAGGRPTRWTRSWPSATGSPAMRQPPTRHEGDGSPRKARRTAAPNIAIDLGARLRPRCFPLSATAPAGRPPAGWPWHRPPAGPRRRRSRRASGPRVRRAS